MASGGHAPADLAPGTVTPVDPGRRRDPGGRGDDARAGRHGRAGPDGHAAPAPTATPEPLPPAATGTGATTAPDRLT